MQFLTIYKWVILGASIGAILGYAYYYFIGCSTGNCPITSNPITSLLYGAVMGVLLFTNQKKKN